MTWILDINDLENSNPTQKLIYWVLTIAKPRTRSVERTVADFYPFMFGNARLDILAFY